MQHDSVFGYMDRLPFPDGQRPEGFHVGDSAGSSSFAAKTELPDGVKITWVFYLSEKQNGEQICDKLICSHPDMVKNSIVGAHMPARYAQRINQDTANIRIFVFTVFRLIGSKAPVQILFRQ
jgi:hypothetical protein